MNVDDPKFVMEGTVTIKDTIFCITEYNFRYSRILYDPGKGSNKHISELADNGIEVLDKFIFKDLRGGQKGTGPNETLLLVGVKVDKGC